MVEMNTFDETNFELNQKESIKLSKMSKGYNWEIKLIGNPVLDDKVFERLKALDDKMRTYYGSDDK